MAWILVSPFERQGFPPAGKSLPVLTTLSSRFSRGTMPALFTCISSTGKMNKALAEIL